MALLGAYMLWRDTDESLEDYLDNKVFANARVTTLMAGEADIRGFSDYSTEYMRSLPIERAAIQTLSDKEACSEQQILPQGG